MGAVIDNRQNNHHFAPDGAAVYFTALDRGHVRLHRVALATGKAETVIAEAGTVGAISLSKNGTLAYPMIVIIHAGPHGQQGPSFNFKSQFYALRGYATLQVNFRGSTGYGQRFADGVFADQNGQEGMDVLWERSSLKHVAKVKTPTMMVHGENDNDVPIAEAEQFLHRPARRGGRGDHGPLPPRRPRPA